MSAHLPEEDGAASLAAPSCGVSEPSRLRGAATLCIAAAAMVATLPGRSQGLGMITEPLLVDADLTRVGFGQMNLWATLIGALFCFPAGRLLDRYGARAMVAGVSLALGLVVLTMSAAHSAAVLFVLIMLTRGLGQSALSVVSIALVGKSFDRSASWPMAVYTLLLSIGFMIAFPAVRYFVETEGWRPAWAGVGVALLMLAAAAWLALRPASVLPSARIVERTNNDAGHPRGLTLGQALATSTFWMFALATALFGLAYSGLGLFNEDVLRERGLAECYAVSLAVSVPFGLLGQAACGHFASIWSYQRLTAVALLLYAMALAALTRVVTPAQLYAAVAVLGVSGGMITVIFFAVWSRNFGHRQLGRIQGAAQMLTVLASAVGPLLFAQSREMTGSYFTVLYALGAIVACVGLLIWFTPSPVEAVSGA